MEKRAYVKKGEEIIGIAVETEKGDKFVIPVVSTARNESAVKQIEKAANIARGSKFMRPSYSVLGYSYNRSYK